MHSVSFAASTKPPAAMRKDTARSSSSQLSNTPMTLIKKATSSSHAGVRNTPSSATLDLGTPVTTSSYRNPPYTSSDNHYINHPPIPTAATVYDSGTPKHATTTTLNNNNHIEHTRALHQLTPVARYEAAQQDNAGLQLSLDDQDAGPSSGTAWLKLNMGGKSYRLRPNTIQTRYGPGAEGSFLVRFASMCHADRVQRCDEYLQDSDEYYFERSARLFDPIFDWFTSGELHRPSDVCLAQFLAELKFWQITRLVAGVLFCITAVCPALTAAKNNFPWSRLSKHISQCCMPMDDLSAPSTAHNTPNKTLGLVANGGLVEQADTSMCESGYDKDFDQITCSKWRYSVWMFTEDPSTSTAAKIFAVCSISFVLMSVAGLILGSMPDLQETYEYEKSNGDMAFDKQPIGILRYVEYTCIGWFTMEYVLRFTVTPNKWPFFKQPLNLIDFITVAPFYLELLLAACGIGVEQLNEIKGAVLVMRIVRVLRVARIFKLARYSTGLKSFGLTVRNSVQELSMLGLFLVTAIIFFSTIVYFLEKDIEGTHFQSIPDACWWCIVTMTTVGYGDSVPITPLGKIVASFASISGVLVLAFPITMIVENFSRNYEQANSEDEEHAVQVKRQRESRRQSRCGQA